jgi:drug/metabolite transporter (DMT)-like permease
MSRIHAFGAALSLAGAVVLTVPAVDHARRAAAGDQSHAAPAVAFVTYAAALAFGAVVAVADGAAANRRRSR